MLPVGIGRGALMSHGPTLLSKAHEKILDLFARELAYRRDLVAEFFQRPEQARPHIDYNRKQGKTELLLLVGELFRPLGADLALPAGDENDIALLEVMSRGVIL